MIEDDLKMENVIKRYGKHLALDYLSLEVSKGEVIGLLGPNGAGKTTCIKFVVGLLPIDEGEIAVFNMKHEVASKEIRSKIGYVTQEITIYEDMTVKENLAFFGRLYGLPKVEAVANRVYIIDQGHVIVSGTLPELIGRIKGDSHLLIDVAIASEAKRQELLAMPMSKRLLSRIINTM